MKILRIYTQKWQDMNWNGIIRKDENRIIKRKGTKEQAREQKKPEAEGNI